MKDLQHTVEEKCCEPAPLSVCLSRVKESSLSSLAVGFSWIPLSCLGSYFFWKFLTGLDIGFLCVFRNDWGFFVVVVVSMINSIFQMLTLCSWGRLHLAVIYYPSNFCIYIHEEYYWSLNFLIQCFSCFSIKVMLHRMSCEIFSALLFFERVLYSTGIISSLNG